MGKNHIKLLLILLVVALVFLGFFWQLRIRQKPYEPNPVRPKDFPEILIVPESAERIDYHSNKTHGIYGLSFVVQDPYPSKNTRHFIEERLSSKGWTRLDYHLLNPDVPAKYPNPLLYDMHKDSNSLYEYDMQESMPYSWIEDWLNKNYETVSVICGYIPPEEAKGELNKLGVNLTFHSSESWTRDWISKYKELHPEEFENLSRNPEPNDM